MYVRLRNGRLFWARDEGQCAFVGPRGRCTERGFLEFHHLEQLVQQAARTLKAES